MTVDNCPFCSVSAERVFHEGTLVRGLWDAFPVSPGHALLVPCRHVEALFDCTPDERAELIEATAIARARISERHTPDGFNIGINVGAAAGQTVSHVHVHVIPRYAGDVPDPRGGVRHVIPSKANYLVETAARASLADAPHGGALVRGDDDPLLPHLVQHLTTACEVDIAVAFVLSSGLDRVEEHLRDLLDRGGRLRILTGDYLGVTEPGALRRLLDLRGDVERRLFATSAGGPASFHPKAWVIRQAGSSGFAFVGSSNLTQLALTQGVEWNYRIVSSRDLCGFKDVEQGYHRLWNHPSARVLSDELIEEYERSRPARPLISVPVEVPTEESVPSPAPNAVQREALAALEATRRAGNAAGLVVLATGLGKTWLSAFDSSRTEFRRVLFVAHREEILAQAMKTFRRIRPASRLGYYSGGQRDASADVVFASIQTLSRNNHLVRFLPDSFDYLIVDEFHHAWAESYRKLLRHFRPAFLLGMTATPERSDGGDLLGFCQENLVYRCDLADGIRRQLLCPFRYFGVPDDVDYGNIPWRSTRFDEEALTRAVATHRRAKNALEQYRTRGGRRTLAFCVSQTHADFMAGFFRDQGVRAVAVHSGETSAPRAVSLESLQAGNLGVVFAVDMFNEGVDLPDLDTVLMLRPTESSVLWMQQFGRGLRRSSPEKVLTVIDYIGNHKVFLLKPRTLFRLGPGREVLLYALRQLREGRADLPPGCEVTYELEAIDILKRLLDRRGPASALVQYYEEFRDLHGTRPTVMETYHDGYNPKGARDDYGSWWRFVDSMGDLAPAERKAFEQAQRFLEDLEIAPMTKSYKMLVLRAMLDEDRFPGEMPIADLTRAFGRIARVSEVLRRDVGRAIGEETALRRLIEANPVAAWAGGRGTRGGPFFAYKDGVFRTTFSVPPEARDPLHRLVAEIVDWRLAAYLKRVDRGAGKPDSFTCKVNQSKGRPILFPLDRSQYPTIPVGRATVLIQGEEYEALFAKFAVNATYRKGSKKNELPEILRRWFGPRAGQPGTRQFIVFELRADRLSMRPVADADADLQS